MSAAHDHGPAAGGIGTWCWTTGRHAVHCEQHPDDHDPED